MTFRFNKTFAQTCGHLFAQANPLTEVYVKYKVAIALVVLGKSA